jgi:hypothetical protein
MSLFCFLLRPHVSVLPLYSHLAVCGSLLGAFAHLTVVEVEPKGHRRSITDDDAVSPRLLVLNRL